MMFTGFALPSHIEECSADLLGESLLFFDEDSITAFIEASPLLLNAIAQSIVPWVDNNALASMEWDNVRSSHRELLRARNDVIDQGRALGWDEWSFEIRSIKKRAESGIAWFGGETFFMDDCKGEETSRAVEATRSNDFFVSLSNITALTFRDRCGLSDAMIAKLLPLQHLKSICILSAEALSSDALKSLAQIQSLVAIELYLSGEIDKSVIEYLALGRPSLTALELNDVGSAADDETLAAIGTLTHLKKLHLTNVTHLTDANVLQLAKLRQVKEVALSNCDNWTGAALGELCHAWTNLERLDVSHSGKLSGEFLLHLASCEKLEDVDVSYCNGVNGEHVARLISQQNIEKLRVRHGNFACLGSLCLPTQPRLQQLWLSNVQLGDRDASAIAQLVSLQYLALDFAGQLTDEGLLTLRPLSQLIMLSIDGCERVKGESFGSLNESWLKLKYLSLRRCTGLTDSGFGGALRMKKLHSIDCRGCTALSSSCLADVPTCRSLRTLNICGCSGIRDVGIEGLAGSTLTNLDYAQCPLVTSNAAAALAQIPSLTEVEVSVNDSFDCGDRLRCLNQLVALQTLHLVGRKGASASTSVSPAPFVIPTPSRLVKMSLSYLTVTPQAIQNAIPSLPRLKELLVADCEGIAADALCRIDAPADLSIFKCRPF